MLTVALVRNTDAYRDSNPPEPTRDEFENKLVQAHRHPKSRPFSDRERVKPQIGWGAPVVIGWTLWWW
jgi:hypothetical protein